MVLDEVLPELCSTARKMRQLSLHHPCESLTIGNPIRFIILVPLLSYLDTLGVGVATYLQCLKAHSTPWGFS